MLVSLWVIYLNVDLGEDIRLFMKFRSYMFVNVFLLCFIFFVCWIFLLLGFNIDILLFCIFVFCKYFFFMLWWYWVIRFVIRIVIFFGGVFVGGVVFFWVMLGRMLFKVVYWRMCLLRMGLYLGFYECICMLIFLFVFKRYLL